MRAGRVRQGAPLLLVLAVAGCVDERPALEPPAAARSASSASAAPSSAAPSRGAAPSAAPLTSPAAVVELPPGPLRDLAPRAGEVPAPLVPLLQASGPRDAAAVAAFSADPVAAQQSLLAHGFLDAYVAQYAAPGDRRALTVVVVRFRGADGAQADLDGDLAASSGALVDAPTVGDASQVRRVELPGDVGSELVTVRFRAGPTTALVAWRAAAPADVEVPLRLARAMVERR